MVDRSSPLLLRRRAIPIQKKKARRAAAPRRLSTATRRARSAEPARAPSRRRASRASRPRAEQPLGVGVGDAFALERLNVPLDARKRREKGVREIGWAEFGELARQLAERIGAEYKPDVILGVVSGGVFLGGALALPLKAEFHPVRVEKRGSRVVVTDALGDLCARSVLVVDDVTASGKTLAAVCAAAEKAGATETRTATLVVRPTQNRSDYHALDTTAVIVFGWDYQLHGDPGGESGDPGEVGV